MAEAEKPVGRTFFVYVGSEGDATAARQFYQRAFDAFKNSDSGALSPRAEAARGYDNFEVLIVCEPRRPLFWSRPGSIWWYSM